MTAEMTPAASLKTFSPAIAAAREAPRKALAAKWVWQTNLKSVLEQYSASSVTC